MIRFSEFFASIQHAIRGVVVVFRHEQSFRIQVGAGVCAIALGIVFHVPRSQLLIMFVMIAAVLSLEMVNSVFERIIDNFKPRIHPIVRDVKDAMAGAVLIVSIISALVGVVIFWPYVAALVVTGT
ncbi:hypothetical protein A2501_01555 [Candidatus Uhrbacteria bacterium RIFOXYC12_FULL_57_11]|nr:MAG: hypothetical protein A2501_01555 [Candidatus Uhrbacteria bacterium RIFOXYC12_FULL_57_11]